jgi:hypothetical protein
MYQGWGYMQKANNMVSKQFARHLDFNTKKNGEFETPHFFSYVIGILERATHPHAFFDSISLC